MEYNTLTISEDLQKYTLLMNDNNIIEGDISPSMFYDLLSLRLDNIYIWQGAAIFALIDNFANKNNLFNYAQIPTDEKGRRLRCDKEAISYKDGAGIYYQRKLWLKTVKKNSTDRHRRLTSTNFINFSNFFGGLDFYSVCMSFGININFQCLMLKELIIKFETFINKITGLKLFKENGSIKYWTIGGISKDYYLNIYAQKYIDFPNNNILSIYQDRHIQNKVFEYEMRNARLLVPGMLYIKDNNKHKQAYKYDINSLFSYTERDCPFLGIPRECLKITKEDLLSNRYEFIIYYKNIHLRKKAGMPAVFKIPSEIYKGQNKNDIFLDEIAFYLSYHDNLLYFYDIIDYEEVKYYKLCKKEDKAIAYYVDTLYNYKVQCKKGEMPIALYPVVKYLLNNLHGKFAQLTIVEDYEYKQNSEGIINRYVSKLNDTWKKGHFDYLRGAWIYSKSQAIMLNILRIFNEKICKNLNITLEGHIFYLDTDCIITDISPEIMSQYFELSDYKLGCFKVEACFEEFQVYAPKTYAGIVSGELKLTVAGMKKNEILFYLKKQNIKLYDSLDYLSKATELPCTVLKRTSEGCAYITEWRPLGKGFNINSEEEEGVLYDCDNFSL